MKALILCDVDYNSITINHVTIYPIVEDNEVVYQIVDSGKVVKNEYNLLSAIQYAHESVNDESNFTPLTDDQFSNIDIDSLDIFKSNIATKRAPSEYDGIYVKLAYGKSLHGILEGEEYYVAGITITQSTSSVTLSDGSVHPLNYFDFYENGTGLDPFSDKRFNPYLGLTHGDSKST